MLYVDMVSKEVPVPWGSFSSAVGESAPSMLRASTPCTGSTWPHRTPTHQGRGAEAQRLMTTAVSAVEATGVHTDVSVGLRSQLRFVAQPRLQPVLRHVVQPLVAARQVAVRHEHRPRPPCPGSGEGRPQVGGFRSWWRSGQGGDRTAVTRLRRSARIRRGRPARSEPHPQCRELRLDHAGCHGRSPCSVSVFGQGNGTMHCGVTIRLRQRKGGPSLRGAGGEVSVVGQRSPATCPPLEVRQTLPEACPLRCLVNPASSRAFTHTCSWRTQRRSEAVSPSGVFAGMSAATRSGWAGVPFR